MTQKFGASAPTTSLGPCPLDLSRFRKGKGILLEEIADRTKISLRFLRAIEAEEFEKLPGGIFNTSYLRQYAEAVGLDESELLAHYDRKVNPGEAAAGPVPATSRGSRSFIDRWLRIPQPTRPLLGRK